MISLEMKLILMLDQLKTNNNNPEFILWARIPCKIINENPEQRNFAAKSCIFLFGFIRRKPKPVNIYQPQK